MKFTLVVTDSHGKNLVFVTEKLQALSLAKAIESVRRGEVPNTYVVQKKTGSYIRTKRSAPKTEQFESLAVPVQNILSYMKGKQVTSTPFNKFLEAYVASLQKGEVFITPVGQASALAADVEREFEAQRKNILAASKQFNIDPYILGATLIDELARLNPFEDVLSIIGVAIIGRNTSVGIAQIKTDTANTLISKGLYNPDPGDLQLPFKKMNRAARAHLYSYLTNPRHSIFFAAANIRSIINSWSPVIDISHRSEIIGTLYSQGYGKPNLNPQPDRRGSQIADEFYPLAKRWLNEL